MEIGVPHKIKAIAKEVRSSAPFLLGTVIMPFCGREDRRFWINGLELDAWDRGSSSRASMRSLRFFPEHEQREARRRVNDALVSYQRRHANPS